MPAPRPSSAARPDLPTTFHLIRHAHTEAVGHRLAGRSPIGLSEAGRSEAAALAQAMANMKLSAVFASPRERAQQTAAPLAELQGLPVQAEPGFDEIDFGDWTGAEFASLHGDPAWRAFNSFRSTARIPGGETAVAVQARAVAALQRLASAWPDAELVVVSHGDVVRSLLAHVLAVPLDLARRIEVLPAHRSVLVLYGDDARVDAFNLPPG